MLECCGRSPHTTLRRKGGSPPLTSSRLRKVSKKPLRKCDVFCEGLNNTCQLVPDVPERTKVQEMEVACGSPVEGCNLENSCFLKDWFKMHVSCGYMHGRVPWGCLIGIISKSATWRFGGILRVSWMDLDCWESKSELRGRGRS